MEEKKDNRGDNRSQFEKMKKEILRLLDDKTLPLISKKLSFGKRGTGGRNNLGRITVRHRGGGHKRRIYTVDYKGLVGQHTSWTIEKFIYNPNASAHKLALCRSEGESPRYKYLPYIEGMTLNTPAPTYEKIGDIRVGTQICNLELTTGKGSQLLRAAGVSGTILKKEGDFVMVKLPSGDIIQVNKENKVIRGRIGNEDHRNRKIGKAGRNRWLGIRPRVRGEAMNPVDHPHGGKSSRSGGLGKPFKNIWGKLAKWSK